jgi:hypothetical protein
MLACICFGIIETLVCLSAGVFMFLINFFLKLKNL